METQTTYARRREKIKTFLIIFLVILLLLTFFSNTILNHSLPTVSAQYASYGVITEKIRGSGIVEANQNYEVKADSSRVVTSVSVKVGDEVKAGDKLFVLDAADNQEAIKAAETALQEAQLAYQKALLTAVPDYAAQNQEIANARADLQTAINRLNQAKSQNTGNAGAISETDYQDAVAQVKKFSSRIEEDNLYLNAVSTGELNSVPSQYVIELQTAKNNLQAAESKLTTAQALVESKSQAITISSSDQEQTVLTLEREAEKATTAYERAKADYEMAGGAETDDAMPEQEHTVALMELQRTMEDAAQSMRYAQEDAENARKLLETILAQERDLQAAQDAVLQANAELAQAQSTYQAAVNRSTALIQEDLQTANAGLETAQSIVTAYETQQTGGAETVDITSLEEAVSQQERNLQNLILALAEQKQEDNLTQQVNQLELKSQQNGIAQQKQELEEMKKSAGTQVITSKNDGIVSNVSVAAGDSVMDGDTLATLNLTSSGYTIQFSATAEQARKIHTGVTAEITNAYYDDITATLAAIRPDTENKNQKLLLFSVTGKDVTSGQSLALSISCSSEHYDCVVPSNAILEDADGKFVLLLKSKNTPLGNRYYASRCDVTVLAHDEINSAVQGDMNSSDFVITNSEKPLTAGTQVRMEENS